ncbi:MAG TPA: hypothetical protein VFQ65_22355 [Kofleriaceae bacterium]|nr:hypothetical protein [Kofleriaceae bacterium]
MSRPGILLCIAFASIGASTARADEPKSPRIAIVPVAAVNLDNQRVDALAQDMAEGLSAELFVDAIGGLDVRRNLRADLPADCASQPACATEVAKATGATQILFVVMVDAGGTGAAQVDATWADPATGKTANRPSLSLASTNDADAKARFKEAAEKFLPDAAVRPKPKLGKGLSIEGSLVGGKPRHITLPAVITGAGAVVGLGIGIGFGLSARSKYDACEANKNACTDAQKDTIRHHDLYADLGWVTAIGAAIASGVIFATSAESPHVVAAPAETGTGGSVFYVGRF